MHIREYLLDDLGDHRISACVPNDFSESTVLSDFLDSLDLVELLSEFSRFYEVRLSPEDLPRATGGYMVQGFGAVQVHHVMNLILEEVDKLLHS